MNEEDDLRRYLARPDATAYVPEPERRNDPGLISSLLGRYFTASENSKLAMRDMEDEARGIEVPYAPGQPSISSREPSYLDRALNLLPEGGERAVRSFFRSPIPSTIGRVGSYMASPEALADLELGGLGRAASVTARVGQARPSRFSVTPAVLTARAERAAARRPTSLGKLFDDVTDPDIAMDMALEGAHIRPKKGGGFSGAPAAFKTEQDILDHREKVLKMLEDGTFGRLWYNRAREGVEDISGFNPATMAPDSPEGLMASEFARGGALYSQQAAPIDEVRYFLDQYNAKALRNEDVRPRLTEQFNKLLESFTARPQGGIDLNPEVISLGPKTGAYGPSKDPTVELRRIFKSVNDIWNARLLGYGDNWNKGLTPAQHNYMWGEMLAIADLANKRGIGSPSLMPLSEGWDPTKAQAAGWVAKRLESYRLAQEEAIAAAIARGDTPPPRLSDEELMEAADFGIDTAVQEHMLDDTFEFVPGDKTGHLGGITEAPEGLRQEYTDRMAEAYLGSPSGRMRDPVYDALQMYQGSVRPIRGRFVNEAGRLENNPAFTANPLVRLDQSTPAGSAWTTNPEDQNVVEMNALLRGLITGQEAVATNKYTRDRLKPGKVDPLDLNAMRYVGPDMDEAHRAFSDAGLDAVEVDGALHVGKFDSNLAPENRMPAQEIMRRARETASGLRGEVSSEGFLNTFYTDLPWVREQGTGATTREVLGMMDERAAGLTAPYARIDEGRMRGAMEAMNAIDRDIAAANNMPLREDLMKLRTMIGEVGLEGLRDYVLKTGGIGLPALAMFAPSLARQIGQRQEPDL